MALLMCTNDVLGGLNHLRETLSALGHSTVKGSRELGTGLFFLEFPRNKASWTFFVAVAVGFYQGLKSVMFMTEFL